MTPVPAEAERSIKNAVAASSSLNGGKLGGRKRELFTDSVRHYCLWFIFFPARNAYKKASR